MDRAAGDDLRARGDGAQNRHVTFRVQDRLSRAHGAFDEKRLLRHGRIAKGRAGSGDGRIGRIRHVDLAVGLPPLIGGGMSASTFSGAAPSRPMMRMLRILKAARRNFSSDFGRLQG